MFTYLFGGKAGDVMAPRPVPNKEIWALLKVPSESEALLALPSFKLYLQSQAGLLDKALIELRKPNNGINIHELDESTGMSLLHVTCAQGAMVRHPTCRTVPETYRLIIACSYVVVFRNWL